MEVSKKMLEVVKATRRSVSLKILSRANSLIANNNIRSAIFKFKTTYVKPLKH